MTAPEGKVVGVGLATVDLLLLWEDMSEPVAEADIRECELQGGGMVGTGVVTVTRLGGRAEFRGRVGTDWIGDLVVRGLRDEGVDVSQVQRPTDSTGPLVTVCVDGATGERQFKGFLNSGLGRGSEQLAEALEGAACLLVDTMLPDVATVAARRAQELRIPVVADMGSGVGESQRDLMAAVDHAIFDERSIRRLAPDGGPREACEAAQRMGPRHVAITRGERGVVSLAGETYRELDAFHVDVVDTTGAGDVFHGAFCYGLLADYEVETNLLFSSAVAAIKCSRLGGRAGIPRMPEVRRFLKERGIALPPSA